MIMAGRQSIPNLTLRGCVYAVEGGASPVVSSPHFTVSEYEPEWSWEYERNPDFTSELTAMGLGYPGLRTLSVNPSVSDEMINSIASDAVAIGSLSSFSFIPQPRAKIPVLPFQDPPAPYTGELRNLLLQCDSLVDLHLGANELPGVEAKLPESALPLLEKLTCGLATVSFFCFLNTVTHLDLGFQDRVINPRSGELSDLGHFFKAPEEYPHFYDNIEHLTLRLRNDADATQLCIILRDACSHLRTLYIATPRIEHLVCWLLLTSIL
jgi:hypothetical protein